MERCRQRSKASSENRRTRTELDKAILNSLNRKASCSSNYRPGEDLPTQDLELGLTGSVVNRLSMTVWIRLRIHGAELKPTEESSSKTSCKLLQEIALAASMLRLSKAGYKIVAHIHDEVVIEAPIGEGSLEEVIDIMCEPEPWNEGPHIKRSRV